MIYAAPRITELMQCLQEDRDAISVALIFHFHLIGYLISFILKCVMHFFKLKLYNNVNLIPKKLIIKNS